MSFHSVTYVHQDLALEEVIRYSTCMLAAHHFAIRWSGDPRVHLVLFLIIFFIQGDMAFYSRMLFQALFINIPFNLPAPLQPFSLPNIPPIHPPPPVSDCGSFWLCLITPGNCGQWVSQTGLSLTNRLSITNYSFTSKYNLQQRSQIIYHVYHIKTNTVTHSVYN